VKASAFARAASNAPAALALFVGTIAGACAARPGGGGLPWPIAAGASGAAGTWRDDPVWRDGLAEVASYAATRTIYGLERRYAALAYTDLEEVDPRTTCKAVDPAPSGAFGAFKHHWSERAPTESYDYDFSTSLYLRADDLASYKLTVGTQEDCGASFKQCVAGPRGLDWWESTYFPGAGTRSGCLVGPDVRFEDELTLLLRDFPFDHPPTDVQGKLAPTFGVRLVPSQKDTRSVAWDALECLLVRGPKSTLELPIGAVEAWQVDLIVVADLEAARAGGDVPVRARYWLAADGKPPWLHVLVRYEGPGGVSYELQSLERRAYWLR
jgi:hypothetical protein